MRMLQEPVEQNNAAVSRRVGAESRGQSPSMPAHLRTEDMESDRECGGRRLEEFGFVRRWLFPPRNIEKYPPSTGTLCRFASIVGIRSHGPG